MTKTTLHSGDPSLNFWLAASKRYPMLTRAEEDELGRRWIETRDRRAADRLVQSHLRLVIKIAMRYRGYGVAIEDVVSEGNIGLVKALDGFDPSRGFRFATYAMWWIRAAITDLVVREASLVRIGKSADQKKLFFSLRRAKAQLGIVSDDLTPEQAQLIASATGTSIDAVMLMNGRLTRGDSSLDAPVGIDGDQTAVDLLVDDGPGPDELFDRRRGTERNARMVAAGLEALNDRERHIMTARVLTDEPQTLEELGQIYGVSRERIRQIEQKAIERFTKRVRTAPANDLQEREAA